MRNWGPGLSLACVIAVGLLVATSGATPARSQTGAALSDKARTLIRQIHDFMDRCDHVTKSDSDKFKRCLDEKRDLVAQQSKLDVSNRAVNAGTKGWRGWPDEWP